MSDIRSSINLSNARHIDGWMSDKELEFLAIQAKKFNTIIEIGSHKGRSTRALADNCSGIVYAIDPWNGAYYTDKDTVLFKSGDHIFTEFVKNLRYCGNVMICRGTFSKFFDELPVADFIFIDGDHRYEAVKSDIQNALKCIKYQGVIAGHDYGDPSWPGVKKAVDEAFGNKAKIYQTIWYMENQ